MQLDMNLLVALDALLEEGSVTGAAARLHLSAPATSRALGRVRAVTGDEILVRTGRTMTLTPRALAMREQVRALVEQAHELLRRDTELDLATLERTFTMRWHDAVTTAVGPRLLTLVRQEAPGVHLRFLPETSDDTEDLRHGRVDLEVNAGQPAGLGAADLRSETVADEELVAVLRAGHPLVVGGSDAVTLHSYLGATHVTVSRRGRLRDAIDDALDTQGHARQVIASFPTVAAALHAVRDSDIIATVPASTASALEDDLRLRRMQLPFPTPHVPLVLTWHRRYAGDPAHAWLRDRVRALLRHDQTYR